MAREGSSIPLLLKDASAGTNLNNNNDNLMKTECHLLILRFLDTGLPLP